MSHVPRLQKGNSEQCVVSDIDDDDKVDSSCDSDESISSVINRELTNIPLESLHSPQDISRAPTYGPAKPHAKKYSQTLAEKYYRCFKTDYYKAYPWVQYN